MLAPTFDAPPPNERATGWSPTHTRSVIYGCVVVNNTITERVRQALWHQGCLPPHIKQYVVVSLGDEQNPHGTSVRHSEPSIECLKGGV